jgi:hypothetical protein
MPIKIKDMDKVEPWSASNILGPGRHLVTIEAAVEGTSSGGHDQVELEFDAMNGSGSIRDWLVFTPATLGKARQLLDAVGIQPAGDEWVFPTDELRGRRLTIVVAQEEYQGNQKTRVQAYLPPETSGESANGAPADDSPLPF